MKEAIVTIEGVSPLQQGKYHETPKLSKEGHADYEKRTWREKCHVDEDGYIFIPPMAFKKSLETAAQYLGIQIPGKGKALYTKHFKSGTLVLEGMKLNVKKEDVPGVWVFGSSTGKSGSGSRVMKFFPTIQEWGGKVTYYILDEIITEDVFTRVVRESGNFIGLGVFRPENGGYYGRFIVKDLEWKDSAS